MSLEIDWCCNKPFSVEIMWTIWCKEERPQSMKHLVCVWEKETEREEKTVLKKDLFSNKLTGYLQQNYCRWIDAKDNRFYSLFLNIGIIISWKRYIYPEQAILSSYQLVSISAKKRKNNRNFLCVTI